MTGFYKKEVRKQRSSNSGTVLLWDDGVFWHVEYMEHVDPDVNRDEVFESYEKALEMYNALTLLNEITDWFEEDGR